MRRHSAQLKGLTLALAVAGATVGGSCAATAASPAQRAAQSDGELVRVRRAVETALTSPAPRGYAPIPPGVRLLAVERGPGAQIVIDFSRELLAAGTGRPLEDALHQIFVAASAARTPAAGRVDDYRVLVDGTALEQYLR